MTESQPPSSRSFSRYLLPSLSDLVFLVAFWSLLMGPLSNRPLADSDIGWHIRTGERILAAHAVPRVDVFSSTMQGQPWFAWEWLYDAMLGVVHGAMGLNGVVWMAALLIATVLAAVFRSLLARGAGLPAAIVLWLLVLGAASIHVFARPHIASWLFTIGWFLALERWEQGGTPWWWRWLFPVSMLAWVNLHGGWVLGLALLAMYGVAALAGSWREPDPLARIRDATRARAIGLAFLWSALATVANPYGLRLHEHIYRYLGDGYLMNRIAEFRSPDFHGWGQRCFVALLVLALLSAGRGAKLRLSQWMVLLFAAWSGLYAVRNLPVSAMLLALIAGPGLWVSVTALAERPGAWSPLRRMSGWLAGIGDRAAAQERALRGHLWPVLGAVAALLVCLNSGRVGGEVLVHHDFDAAHFPSKAVDFLLREPSSVPVLGPDQWGGYLVYRLYPKRLVQIDDRHDLYGSERFRDYLILIQGEPAWREVLEKWDVRTVVLSSDATLASLLRQLPHEWSTVYEDRNMVVMERMPPGH